MLIYIYSAKSNNTGSTLASSKWIFYSWQCRDLSYGCFVSIETYGSLVEYWQFLSSLFAILGSGSFDGTACLIGMSGHVLAWPGPLRWAYLPWRTGLNSWLMGRNLLADLGSDPSWNQPHCHSLSQIWDTDSTVYLAWTSYKRTSSIVGQFLGKYTILFFRPNTWWNVHLNCGLYFHIFRWFLVFPNRKV